ncbi:carbohydrate esterase family 16 protein [Aspergillus carbonarius ITEM 5010]|uniref:Carbohydrate esterase family 16 protein n=1 Tax=Aspergillus carbonarius (strain ITEM 5010) TaxID=602072 RepID=A0A1R3RNN8_ASPC5|nr:carbohydrate esterase family 16 protein [Aspergillus carbonarius ITEM 5010]
MKLQPSWLLASSLSTVAANTTSPTYFFTFGDSYSQTGFSTSSTQPSASNPMGNPDLGIGTTTNGPNWIGYLTTTENSSLVLSYNLAVGGATIDNSLVSAYAGDVSSQVKLFEDVYSTKPTSAPWTSENAVFGVWIGINDIGNAFYNTDAETFTPKLTSRLQSLMQEIYDNGGRKFLFLNVPPTNRTPMFIDQGNETTAEVASYLEVYNRNLKSMVEGWARERGDITTVFYDAWSFMSKVLNDPTAYGFPDATCINDDGTSCVWWNNYHPGMKYHSLQAADMKKYLGSLGGW